MKVQKCTRNIGGLVQTIVTTSFLICSNNGFAQRPGYEAPPPTHTHAVHTTLPVGRGGDGDVEGTSVRRTAYNDQQR